MQPNARKIAVVDDDAFMVKIMTMMITRIGSFEVTGFADSRSALEAITAEGAGFDTVILDLNMPDIDGFEFFRRLAHARCDCALILCSGETDSLLRSAADIAQAQGLRVAGNLPKPPRIEVMTELLLRAGTRAAPAAQPRRAIAASDLLAAVAAGEIFCLYAPVVEARSGSLLALGASVRWGHAHEGVLAPDAFMQVADNAGMSALLTREVFEMALAQQARWRAQGLELTLSVPAAGQALEESDFPDFAAECAARHGVPPASIVVRLDEASLAAVEPTFGETIARLRLRKFSLTLDDFGAHGLPLRVLRDVAFQSIRVAPALVAGAHSNLAAGNVLQACVDVAQRIGAESTAAGVADRADWDFCRKIGFDRIDGPFIAEPMPGEAAPAWERAWQARVWTEELAPRLPPRTSRLAEA